MCVQRLNVIGARARLHIPEMEVYSVCGPWTAVLHSFSWYPYVRVSEVQMPFDHDAQRDAMAISALRRDCANSWLRYFFSCIR